MIAHRCLGLTSRGLMTYLAALGLAKVISEQADPDVRFGWTGDTFVLRTAVPDLAEFLVRDYRPTPIVGMAAADSDRRTSRNETSLSD